MPHHATGFQQSSSATASIEWPLGNSGPAPTCPMQQVVARPSSHTSVSSPHDGQDDLVHNGPIVNVDNASPSAGPALA